MGITFIENEIEKALGKKDKLTRLFDLYEFLGERLKEIILEEKDAVETVYLIRYSQEEKEKGKQDVIMTVEIDENCCGNCYCIYLKKNGKYVFYSDYREDGEEESYIVKRDLSDTVKMSFAEYMKYDKDISPTHMSYSQN